MPRLKFSEQWDKLKPENFKVNNNISTFRAYDIRKMKYYQDNYDKIWDIILDGKQIGRGKMFSLRTGWSCHLGEEFIKKDTYEHYTEDDFEKLLKRYYNFSPVFGIILWWSITEVNQP